MTEWGGGGRLSNVGEGESAKPVPPPAIPNMGLRERQIGKRQGEEGWAGETRGSAKGSSHYHCTIEGYAL